MGSDRMRELSTSVSGCGWGRGHERDPFVKLLQIRHRETRIAKNTFWTKR